MNRITAAVASLSVAVSLSVGAGPLHAQSVVTGAPTSSGLSLGQDGSNGVSLGQSFLVPSGATTVQSFSVFLRNNAGMTAIPFRAHLVAWNPVLHRAVGPVLWQSASMNAVSSAALTRMDFAVPDVAVSGGNSYMLFLSSAGFYAGSPSSSSAGILALTSDNATDTYAGGQAYVQLIPTGDLTSVLSSAWAPFQFDHAVVVNFGSNQIGVVPEPATNALLAGGLLAIWALSRSRRRDMTLARVRAGSM